MEPRTRALMALRRSRRIETDLARRDLGVVLAHEADLIAGEQAIAREVEGARREIGAFDPDVFAAWLGRMAARRAALGEEARAAAETVAAARRELAARRMAETAAEDALGHIMAERALEVARRDQMTLEDVARALRRGVG